MAVFPQASVLFNVDPNWTAAQARVEFERWLASTLQLPGAAEAEALTIATGQITPTRAAVIVDTEGGTSADDLTTIATTNMHAGAVLMLCAANSGRTVTVKHGTGAGGIALLGGVDCALSTTHWLMLRRVGDAWAEMPPLRAAQAQQAATAAACTGNAVTATLAAAASDMAAGHVLAGKKTAEAVRGAIGALSPEVGKYNNYRITTAAGQALANGVLSNILTTGPNSGNLNVTPDSGDLGWTIQESGTYRFDLQLPLMESGTLQGFASIFLKRNRAGSVTNVDNLLVGLPTNEAVWLYPYMHSVCECQAGDIMYFTVQANGTTAGIHASSGWATITRIR
ncbi:hypothetical protein [Nitratidesulfovibrio vulgaris]|uniref:Uncharacterized protein n=1 Tax=Nitratidesulfovibrio vulgaris (strain ATCC 29579 / DSM 644 / CCUG 34227 / NCIMB 8303 / VKM B-1760 / Hildenborough) TaxID=882 RepID=Q72A45_NITV2|nr:hypothetical protein [Nitratidesulfovibrio vulgaris]AAS96625.1 hypothetical protein DVU_2152 [Nitratidesulfovibrio vulgaris str. Hildenborough]ADP87150.1 hypothetical protein Deval_2002 [Nitratidesulfovibrio vulgaris RCH1]